MLESKFKSNFKDAIKNRIGSKVNLHLLEPDSSINRSAPDLIILGPVRWAALEFKRDSDSDFQPNQEHTIFKMDKKGFAKVVHPGNVEEVLYGLEKLFLSE